jgi:hypothetical protein
MHAKNRRTYIWSPPLIIADMALEECMNAVYKQTDAFHVFLIPRLYSPLWTCMFYKQSDFVFQLSPGLRHWPKTMHKPLFIGISLPLLTRSPWTLQKTPLLVGMEWKLHQWTGSSAPTFANPKGACLHVGRHGMQDATNVWGRESFH